MGSCARLDIALSLELRQAQLANVSAIQHNERKMFLRLGDETQDKLRQQKAHRVHEQHQLAEEGEARIHFDRQQVESEQRAAFEDSRISLTKTLFVKRHNVSATTLTDPNRLHSFREEVENSIFQLIEARKNLRAPSRYE